MKYDLESIEIRTELDFGRLELDFYDIINDLEPYEEPMYRTSYDEIIIDAMNVMNGDIRTVATLCASDYADIICRKR